MKIINVNYEKGAALLEKCNTLDEYSRFIYMIREKAKDMKLQQAVEKLREDLKKREQLLKI